ncbi:MAG: cobyrinic acid a,c-diamide synthase [Candidatus Nitrosocaldaceae archaeon]|nr:MAG: cobyrinic acid a,c-diamide synthase [Candidatus Nitrosocaldaceae archaeon]
MRIIIAGVTSGVGKTSITIGLMHALKKQGYKVQGFKVGPDYIDPSYHTVITDRDSRNLDAWLMGNNGVIKSFINASKDADISVIEGVMGLFDGLSGKNDMASTAHIARLLKAPIILVLDASKTARSIAAIAYGFMKFDPRLEIAGVILNNIASKKHAEYCVDALKSINTRVLGVVERNNDVKLEERHLGLIPTGEERIMIDKAKQVAEYISEKLLVDEIIKIAENAKALDYKIRERKKDRTKVRIGLALDNSFNFYYADNIDRLRKYGAEIIPFSPIRDQLPEVDGLYIGGGFPEILAEELSKNSSVMKDIKDAAYDGMPIYAECGGLMYLAKSITDFDNNRYNMVGLFDMEAVMTKRLTLNYTYANTINDSLILVKDSNIKGHEFHHSLIEDIKEEKFAYQLKRGKGIDGKRDGVIINNTLAAYMHIYFNDKIAKRFVEKCIKYNKK